MKQILHKNTKMKQIENKEGVSLEEVLRLKYVDKDKPAQQIAQELSVDYTTIIRWLKRAGIHSRKLKL